MAQPQYRASGQKLFTRGDDEKITRAAMDLLRQEGPSSVNAHRIAEHLGLPAQHVDELFPGDDALWRHVPPIQ